MPVELVELPRLPLAAGLDEPRDRLCIAQLGGDGRPVRIELRGRIEPAQESDQGLVCPERTVTIRTASDQFDSWRRIEPGDQGPRPLDLGRHGPEPRGRQPPRRAAGPRRDDEFGTPGRLDD